MTMCEGSHQPGLHGDTSVMARCSVCGRNDIKVKKNGTLYSHLPGKFKPMESHKLTQPVLIKRYTVQIHDEEKDEVITLGPFVTNQQRRDGLTVIAQVDLLCQATGEVLGAS